MSDSAPQPLASDDLQGTAREFLEYCTQERERRRDSGAPFDDESYQQAVELVLRRLQNLEQEGSL